MIQVTLPDPAPTVDLNDILAPVDAVPVEDQTAISMVVQEFSAFEWFRQQNHDPKWMTYDALYLGRVPIKNWEGSRVQRSALPRRLSYDHLETAVPAVSNALFGGYPEWFQVEADADTTPLQAQAVQGRLRYLLDHAKTRVGSPGQAEIRLAIRQALKYGNGGLELKYDTDLKQATIEWCDIRDIYVDPTCPTPNIDEATAVVRRRLMTVQEVNDLRFDPMTGQGDQRMKIPSLEWLQTAARTPFWAAGDQTKQMTEALRGVSFTPGSMNYSPSPAGQRIEVLIYYTKDRIIWVLDRRWLMYNDANPFGFIPLVFAPFVIFEGGFHGLSMIDAIASYQRYAESLQNNHLDEQNLALHPPRLIQNMPNMTPTQQAWRPGATMSVPFGTNPKDMINVAEIRGITSGTLEFVQQLDMLAEKSTGVNSMSMGVPRPSNANRTAGGMQMQAGGTSLRLSDFVRNLEDYLIIPMLDKLWRIEQLYNANQQQVPVATPNGVNNVEPQLFANARPKFRMLASSKMVTRDRLIQVLPLIMNTIMSGPMMQALQQSGQTIDFTQLLQMVEDATGIGHVYQLVRPLNQQEAQALQQPSPQQQQDAQKAQQDAQVRLQMGQMKSQTDLQIAQIDAQSKTASSQAAVQAAQQKAQIDMVKSLQDLKIKQAQGQQKLAQTQQESQMKMALAKNDLMVQLLQQAIDQRKWQTEMGRTAATSEELALTRQ